MFRGQLHKSWTLYNTLLGRVRQFPKGGVRAILWHQGESDSTAKTAAEAYCNSLKTIIDSLNNDVGYELPWFVAQASYRTKGEVADQAEVAKGQQLLWEKGFAKRGPNTDVLGPEYRVGGVHFNQRGLTAHADKWFEALAAEYKWKR